MNAPKITEKEIAIIKSAQTGDPRAFNKLFNYYKPFVENLLNLYLKDMDEARDLTNEVFLKVYQKLSKFTSYNSFGGWLRTLTKNTAIDYLRHKTEDLVLDDSESGIEPIEPSSEDEQLVVDKITYDWIIKEMDTLPPLYRDVCLLYYKDNLTVKQISEAKNIPKGTVKSYLFRFRKKFNKKY